MKDHNSPEAQEERASQEDPIVMYLIVHESLNMGVGKTAAQAAHASQMLTLAFFELKEQSKFLQKLINSDNEKIDKAEILERYKELAPWISIMGEWLNSSFRKVVLRASDKEWAKLKEDFKNQHMVMVVDAGLTEIAAGSETFIGLWPMRKSQRPKSIQRLQVLK